MRKRIILVTLLMTVICMVFIFSLAGRETYTVSLSRYSFSDFNVTVTSEDTGIVRITDYSTDGEMLTVELEAVSKGKTFIDIVSQKDESVMIPVFVHTHGIITVDNFFGYNSASRYIPVAVFIVVIYAIGELVYRYGSDVRRNMYSYRNLLELGLIIFLSFLAIGQVSHLFSYDGLIDTVQAIIDSSSDFSFVTLPVAFVAGIVVTISNIRLVKREGRNWRNMLGMILGVFFCFSTFLPDLISDYLQWHSDIDVHNMRSIWNHLDRFIENGISITVAYLECILLATIISALRAARRIPDFNRDCIIILGSQINSDGTLTRLLQGRADRAIEFADMQKKATGKDIVFIASGGKGDDEVMAEGTAIGNYLYSQGIDRDKVIIEDRSTNTEENFLYSLKLAKEKLNREDVKVAFSTTNYHVYRAGVFAGRLMDDVQGIGAWTRSYFLINAFIREYIATLSAERQTHLQIILALLLILVGLLVVNYLSIIL